MPTDTPITNTTATETPSNYEICQRTGFLMKRDELRKEWNGLYVRDLSFEHRNIQDLQRMKSNEHPHPPGNPEPDDAFIEDRYPDGVTQGTL